ncbi:TrmH family RNA methyltransferase [Parafrankia discariae]|uniref:TrmH family RNA methyltransferase n=1 Tax=Parafrankia discariae TaxID=365528 RepID=UPI0006849DFF|nr:RNA methyltransferase [Parafrankia discariae]
MIDDPADPRVADYVALTDVALRRRREPAEGLFIAEGERVIDRALRAGYRPRSVLVSPARLGGVPERFWSTPGLGGHEGQEGLGGQEGHVGYERHAGHVGREGDGGRDERSGRHDAPVYVAGPALLAEITGFEVHRGALASMCRRPLLDPVELLRVARRVLVCEDLVSHTNLGAIFRSAAGLGMDAVLLSPRCADPLYRRSVRVSMGEVFAVPYARLDPWPGALSLLGAAGFEVLALTPAPDADELTVAMVDPDDRVALLLGTEGQGLTGEVLATATRRVRIPMAHGVDSLNVAATAAIACYVLGVRS